MANRQTQKGITTKQVRTNKKIESTKKTKVVTAKKTMPTKATSIAKVTSKKIEPLTEQNIKTVKKTIAKKGAAKKALPHQKISLQEKTKSPVVLKKTSENKPPIKSKDTPKKEAASLSQKKKLLTASQKDNKTSKQKMSVKKLTQPQKEKLEKNPMAIPSSITTSPEDYMNAEQRKHFRNILLNWKKELLDEMERTVHHMQDDAASFADPNDRATQEEEFSLELRARDRERKLIKKIEEALLNLDQNEYGYCEACGVEIGVQRLEARPTATLCIECKTIEEIREKSTIG